jgi:hypothetical protein
LAVRVTALRLGLGQGRLGLRNQLGSDDELDQYEQVVAWHEQRWEIANLEQRHGALQAELDSATTAMRAEGGAAATLEAPETALARARAAVAAVAQLGGVTITADEPTVLILQSAGGGYRLALDFDASALSGATLTPSDVEIDDIVAAAIAPGIGGAPRKGPAWLIREVRARLS